MIPWLLTAMLAANAPSSNPSAVATPPAPAAATLPNKQPPPTTASSRKRASRAHVSPAVARVAAANRAATLEPDPQGFVNAAQVFPFSDGAIYRAYVAPGAVTDIVLQPGEALTSVAAGDTVRWVIGDTTSGVGSDKRVHVLVKPFAVGLGTNLVITTDRRTYHLQLTATIRTAMAVVSWTYPADDLIAVRRAAEQAAAAAPVAGGLSVDNLRFDYVVGGDSPAWRPLRAFDDGRQTFIQFPLSLSVGEAPPLFVIGPTGDVELVNYRLRGRYYVVDRIFDSAELRLGTKKQQVVRISRIGEASAPRKGRRS